MYPPDNAEDDDDVSKFVFTRREVSFGSQDASMEEPAVMQPTIDQVCTECEGGRARECKRRSRQCNSSGGGNDEMDGVGRGVLKTVATGA